MPKGLFIRTDEALQRAVKVRCAQVGRSIKDVGTDWLMALTTLDVTTARVFYTRCQTQGQTPSDVLATFVRDYVDGPTCP